jgi:hypothetical protein
METGSGKRDSQDSNVSSQLTLGPVGIPSLFRRPFLVALSLVVFVVAIGSAVVFGSTHHVSGKSERTATAKPVRRKTAESGKALAVAAATPSVPALPSNVQSFYALELRGLTTPFSVTYLESGVSTLLGSNPASVTVTAWNSPTTRQQAFEEISPTGRDEEIMAKGLTLCVRYFGKQWTCTTIATPLMGAYGNFQMDYPPLAISLQVSNFLGFIQGLDPMVNAHSVDIVREKIDHQLATCLVATATGVTSTQSGKGQVARLDVCLSRSGLPLSFSQDGVYAGMNTRVLGIAISSTVTAADFESPVPATPGH